MSMNDSIKNAVKKKVPAVTIDDTILTAIKAMTEANTSALVVKTGDDLIGIITEMDMMQALTNNANINETKVATIMTACDLITSSGAKSPCVQLDEDQSVASALSIMNEAGVHHLLVSGRNGQAAGMISAKDLFRQYIV